MSDAIYSVRIKESAAKALRKINANDRAGLVEAIDRLAREPSAGSALKGEFSGLRRLRVGPYRVIYETRREELSVLVVRIGNRANVYRHGKRVR